MEVEGNYSVKADISKHPHLRKQNMLRRSQMLIIIQGEDPKTTELSSGGQALCSTGFPR